MLKMNVEKIREDLGSFLFGVCGVPGVPKREVFISHEHRDEVPDPGDLLLKCPDAVVYMSNETLAVLKGKVGTQSVLAAFRVNFKDRFKVRPTEYMWYGKVWDVNGACMFRIEHDSPDPMFRSHVAFGFAKKELFCYFSETTGRFLIEYGERILDQVKPKYVLVSPPSAMHRLSIRQLEEFNRRIDGLSFTLLMAAGFLRSDEVLLSEEVGVEPCCFIVLPKIVDSVFDTYGPSVW